VLIPLRARDGSIRAHATIDEQDAHLAEHRWHLSNGYVRRSDYSDGRRDLLLHRVILGLTPGDGLQGDHIDGNPLDCRRSNLRVATNAQNTQNQRAAGGSSRHRGVAWHKATGKWSAQVRIQGRLVYLGLFADEAAAAEAARVYRLAHMPFTNEARAA
jgi:hypothetical protein